MNDKLWHKQLRQDMPETYDAIWRDGFWKGMGLTLIVVFGMWFLDMVKEYLALP